MKNRVVSFILAVVMLTGMLPAVSANDGSTGLKNYDFKFTNISHTSMTADTSLKQYTVDGTATGFDKWGYVTHGGTVKSFRATENWAQWSFLLDQGIIFDKASGTVPPALTLELVIDEPGAYTPSLKWDKTYPGPKVDYYLIKKPENPDAWAADYKNSLLALSDDAFLGKVDMQHYGDKSPKELRQISVRDGDEGSYYLILIPNGGRQGFYDYIEANGIDFCDIRPASLTLTAIPRTFEKVYLNAERNYILPDDTDGLKLDLTALYGTGDKVNIARDAESVKFISSDEETATVTDDGTVIPVKEGEFTVTAYVTVNGVTKDASIKLSVSELKNYDFSFTNTSHIDMTADTSLEKYTVAGTVGGYDKWGYVTHGGTFKMLRATGDWAQWSYKYEQGFIFDKASGTVPPAITFEVIIDKPGTYIPGIKWDKTYPGPKVDYYLIKKPTNPDAWAADYKNSLLSLSDDAFLGKVDMQHYGDKSPKELRQISVKDGDEGSYYLILIPNGGRQGFYDYLEANPNIDYCDIRPASLTLTEIPRTFENAYLRAEHRYILLDDADGMELNLTAKYGTGEVVNLEKDATVEFKSSDESIATVSADGTVIPVSEGNVTITANVTVKGVAKTATIELTVSKTPVAAKVKLDFNYEGLEDCAAVVATVEEHGWAINREKTDSALLQGMQHRTFYGIQIPSGIKDVKNEVVFDFEVPETGAYDISFKHAKAASGGIAYVYIDNIYVGEINFYDTSQINSNTTELRPVALGNEKLHTLTLISSEVGGGNSGNMYPGAVFLNQTTELAKPTEITLDVLKAQLFLGENVSPDVKYVFQNGVKIPAHDKKTEKVDVSAGYTLETEGTAITVGNDGELVASEIGSAKVRAVASLSKVPLESEWISIAVEKIKLSSAKIKAPKQYLLLSNTGGMKLGIEAKYNNGEAVDMKNDATVAFRSSDEAIATVSADGIVMPVAQGEAVIYADVTVDEVLVTAETVIIISKTPVYSSFELDFNYEGLEDCASVVATIDEYGWEINKEKTDSRFLENGVMQHRTLYGIQIPSGVTEGRNTVAIDFVVPDTAAYDITMKHARAGYGGIAYIYIDGIYAGEVDFYNEAQINENSTSLRSFILEEGKKHTLTLVASESGAKDSCNMYPGALTLAGTEKLTGIMDVRTEIARSSIAAGETEPFGVFARQENGVEFFPRASLDGVTETGLNVKSMNESVAVIDGEFIKAIAPGKAKIRVSGTLNGSDIDREFDFTVNNETFASAEIDVVFDEFYVGGTTKISATGYLSDGRKINDRDISVSFTSDNTDVASVEGDVLSTKAKGEALITAHVTFNGNTLTAEEKINVVPVELGRIEASIDDAVVSAVSETGSKINVKAFNNDGTEASIEGAIYSYESKTPEIVGTTSDGYVYYIKRGTGIVSVTANVGGVDFTYELEVVSSSGKTEPTIYTYTMRENARDNISKYAWAKSMQKSAVAKADDYLANFEKIYGMISYEGLPRASVPGTKDDPEAYCCVYCKTDIRKKYGSYGWGMDPFNRPWKIQCPECKRLFPSNEFEKFYELGLDQKGQFDRQRALEKHGELFGEPGNEYGYGKGYLENKLYKDVGKDLGVAADKVATWAVDDGYGWDTRTETENGYPVKKAFIAVYNHFLYSYMKSCNVIIDSLDKLREAYIYTGDIKYGRAGAILIDRLADVYPSYDLNPYAWYQNSHGGYNTGKILGAIWETSTATALARAYDAFWPAMEDPEVIAYLSEKAGRFGLENKKTSADLIRENCETGILREIFKGADSARIWGNFGMHQESVALAGIALDTYPESAEMFEWIARAATNAQGTVNVVGYQDRTAKIWTKNSGGDLFKSIIGIVDRDGFGNEVSADYNSYWVSDTLKMAEAFHRYGKYDEINLYKNPKYKKMLLAILNMTVGSGYTLQLGDHGGTGTLNNSVKRQEALTAFERIGDPVFAQVVYLLTKGQLSSLYIDIYEKNAEEIQDRIKKVVEEYGELNLGSRNLTGFGFAVLAGGEIISGTGAHSDSNFSRDTWLWYGDTTGAHAHSDKMQMGINAYGFNFTPDLGYPETTSYDPNRLQWVSSTLSHNTVMVDGLPQTNVSVGTPAHYDASGIVKVIDADGSDTYESTDVYRRTLVTVDVSDTDAYTVDFFRIRGGKEHVYSFHTQSCDGFTVDGLELTPQVNEKGEYVGSYAGANVDYGKDPDTQDTWFYDTKYPRGYTWLKNVRRDDSPESGTFSVNFKQTDFRKSVPDASGLNLKFTALNDWTPSSVGFAAAQPPRTATNKMIPHLDYMLIHNKGSRLDTLFTSVLQPYNGQEYIDAMASVPLVSDGSEGGSDVAKAIKVKLKSGRCDYIIYATNSDVVYTLTDGDVSFDFSGFLGVYSVNERGKNVYAYVNDGGRIGDLTATARYTGTVISFTEELSEDNFITVKFDSPVSEEEVGALAGRYIYINNKSSENAAYEIQSAEISGDEVVLDIGFTTLINSYKNSSYMERGYVYDIEPYQLFTIPLSAEYTRAPEIEKQDDLTTSAESSISITVSAKSPDGEKISYIGKVMPRGASIDSATGKIMWKPDSSQVGKSGFMITARDESGRESSVSFEVTVYGKTTGSSDKESSSGSQNSGTLNDDASGGGGGGGGAAPSDKPEDEINTDSGETPDDIENGDAENAPEGSGETDNIRFTDLGNYAWAESAINELAADGIIKGTSASTFSPATNITRADFALLLVRAFDLKSDNTENFADVEAYDYFASELAIARNTGIIGGIGDNKYAPRNSITRQDMMVIVHRALIALGVDLGTHENPQYEDFTAVADYAKPAVSALISAGIVNGKNGIIAPLDYTTRAEVAVLLQRVMNKQS